MKVDTNYTRRENRARCVAIYFIREITKDVFKWINDYFCFSSFTGAVARHGHVVMMYKKRAEYRKEIDELWEIMIKRFSLEKQLVAA